MPIINGCCCYADLEKGSKAASYFTMVTAILNIIIDIWALVHLHRMEHSLEAHEKWILIPPGLLVFMYLEMGCNIGLILVSLCLLVGINRGIEGKRLIYSWIMGCISFRGYEVLLGIYCLAWIGSYRVSDMVYVVPEFIVITMYWCLNTVILIVAVICVISYWQENMNYAYGKQHRTKYFTMLANVRNAAKKKHHMGTAPSVYSYMARSAMTGSHMTLSGPGQPMAHSSTQFLEPPQHRQPAPGQPMAHSSTQYLEGPHSRQPIPSVSSTTYQQPYYVPGMPQKMSQA